MGCGTGIERRIACAAMLCLAFASGASPAQAPSDSPQLTIAQVLGIRAGDRPVSYVELERYLEAVSRASDRVRLSVYGETALARKLRVMTVSSPDNLARLDAINLQLARLAAGTDPDQEATALARTLPAVVWIGYGTHADELSGSDTGMRLIERLLTGRDADTMKLLDKLVVYVDPMVNPDGRERFLTHITSFQRETPVPDAQDIVQHEFWPPTRFNHYLIDLNRDALFVTQAQSAARVRAIHAAHPQLFVDAHEMNLASTYLFALPAEPLNPYLPQSIHRAWKRFGADIAQAHDREGQSYYTRSWNEVFYPGFYDILPAYSGITPLLYEQARTSGVTVTLPNGRTRTFAQAVENHLRSSLATLTSAADNHEPLFADWLAARRQGLREVRHGPRAWLVPPGNELKMERLIRLLETHQITYQRLASPIRASGLRSMWSATPQTHELPAGTLLVRSAQPAAGLIRNLFDFHVPMSDAFIREERQRVDLRRKTQIYDITSWSLPLAFDLAAYWSADIPRGNWRDGTDAPESEPHALRPARYGYLYEDPSLFTTLRLLSRGVKVRVATESFEHSGRAYGAGSFLIRNDDQLQEILPTLGADAGSRTRFREVEGARAEAGPDLGDDKFALLSAPKIAILVGSGTQGTSVGALWHLFDAQIRVPVTLLDLGRLQRFDLSRYNVVVLPDIEDRTRLSSVLTGGAAEMLARWVEGGGTLIALGGGALVAADLGLTALRPRAGIAEPAAPTMLGRPALQALSDDLLRAAGASPEGVALYPARDEDTAPVVSEAAQALLPARQRAYAFPERLPSFQEWAVGVPEPDALLRELPMMLRGYLPRGAYLKADLKPLHWLRYGADDRIPVLFRETDVLLAASPVEIIGRYAKPRELVLSGLVWPEALGYIAETAYLTREKRGEGQFIAFAHDATFRAYSLGTQRLFLNAVVLGPGLRSN